MPDLPPEIEPIVLAVLEARVKEAEAAARAAIEHLYAEGTCTTILSLLDGTKLGTVYRTDPNRRGRSPTATPSATPSKRTPTTSSTSTTSLHPGGVEDVDARERVDGVVHLRGVQVRAEHLERPRVDEHRGVAVGGVHGVHPDVVPFPQSWSPTGLRAVRQRVDFVVSGSGHVGVLVLSVGP
jgi:hypothetical protein